MKTLIFVLILACPLAFMNLNKETDLFKNQLSEISSNKPIYVKYMVDDILKVHRIYSDKQLNRMNESIRDWMNKGSRCNVLIEIDGQQLRCFRKGETIVFVTFANDRQ